MNRPSKSRYLLYFLAVVLLLTLVKRLTAHDEPRASGETSGSHHAAIDTRHHLPSTASLNDSPRRILGVQNYQTAFPDSQAVQLPSAARILHSQQRGGYY